MEELTSEEWEEVVTLLQSERIIVRTQSGTTEGLGKEETLDGEIYWMKDQNIVSIGEDGVLVEDLPLYIPMQFFTPLSDSLDKRMSSYWQRLEHNTTLGEVVKIIMPRAHTTMFESLKPSSFSLLRGEFLTGSSFEGAGWTNAPDAQGRFLGTGDETNQGTLFDHDFQEHFHHTNTNYPNSVSYYSPINPDCRYQTVNTYRYGGNGLVGAGNTTAYGTGETRPKNIAILSIWKIREI